MLIVGYCFGIRSERRLCDEVHTREIASPLTSVLVLNSRERIRR
jgi:hypothetical protein